MKRILVVEDDKTIRESLAALLEGRFEVTAAEDGSAALSFAREKSYDLILSDVHMPAMDGMDLFREVKKFRPGQKFVFLTVSVVFDEDPDARSIVIDQADAYLGKPYRVPELFATIEKVLAKES